MTGVVKGCKMPAPSRRPVSVRKPLNGQASDKPRGRKPREEGTRSLQAVALWGFEW